MGYGLYLPGADRQGIARLGQDFVERAASARFHMSHDEYFSLNNSLFC